MNEDARCVLKAGGGPARLLIPRLEREAGGPLGLLLGGDRGSMPEAPGCLEKYDPLDERRDELRVFAAAEAKGGCSSGEW